MTEDTTGYTLETLSEEEKLKIRESVPKSEFDEKAIQIVEQIGSDLFDMELSGAEAKAKHVALISSALSEAAASEREECAKIAATNFADMTMIGASYVDGAVHAGERISDAIRSRKEKHDA